MRNVLMFLLLVALLAVGLSAKQVTACEDATTSFLKPKAVAKAEASVSESGQPVALSRQSRASNSREVTVSRSKSGSFLGGLLARRAERAEARAVKAAVRADNAATSSTTVRRSVVRSRGSSNGVGRSVSAVGAGGGSSAAAEASGGNSKASAQSGGF